jgi:type VI secretion system VgrG family protein
MEYLTAKKFSFHIKGLSEDTFGVVNFTGTEEISKLYEFTIMLVSDNIEIDFKSVINKTAKLIFHRGKGGDIAYNGIIAHFEQLNKVDEYAFYRAYLVPKLWRLSMTQYNQIFLDKTVQQFIKEILINEGLTVQDYEFRIQGSFEPLEYVCQYGESNFNFISRWLEREGICYYFEQTDHGEKVIFTNSKISHINLPDAGDLIFSPPSALETFHKEESITSFHCRQTLMPAKVFLKDYNDLKPSLDITGEADVHPNGFGTVYNYHEHIKSPDEGKNLAKIMAEALLCRREEYRGEGSVPFMLPGFTFSLQKHFRNDFNRKYLITSISHEGDQSGYLLKGIQSGDVGDKHKAYYSNSFVSIPADIQFRPERRAHKPRISGTINGKIDAGGSGKYAELDEYGRYKVTIPFDISGRKDGKASAWIRMAQPYAGSNHGMHFPLHKGTEVLLTFINGDPDRPVIAAALPNAENPSVVGGTNVTQSGFTTAGGNSLYMDDTDGGQHIVLRSGDGSNAIILGGSGPPQGDNLTEGDNKKDNNSDAGVSVSSQWWYQCTQNSMVTTALVAQDYMSMLSIRNITGWLKLQALYKTLSKTLTQKAAPLISKTYKDRKKQDAGGKDPGYGNKWDAGAILGLIAPVLAIVEEIGLKEGLKRYITNHIGKKNATLDIATFKEIIDNARYMVICIDDGVLVHQTTSQIPWKKDKKHLAIVAGDPGSKTLLYSENDTSIVAGNDLFLEADKDVVIDGERIKIAADKKEVSIQGEETVTIIVKNNKINIEKDIITIEANGLDGGSFIEVNEKEIYMEQGKDKKKTKIELKKGKAVIRSSQNEITMDDEEIQIHSNKSKMSIRGDNISMNAPNTIKIGPLRKNKQNKVFID